MAADQRGPVSRRTHILAAEPHRAVGRDGQVPDRQPVQRGIQLHPLQQLAAGRVQIGQGRAHGVQVQLQLAVVRMRQDAAIGHAQRLAVGQQQHLVRPDAAAIEFAHAPVRAAGRGVVDAEHTASAVEIIFGGGQQPAVVEERAMAEEMPVLRQVQFNGPAAPSRPKPSAKKPGWRPKTTARPPAASMAKLWPRAGIGTTRRSRPDSSSSAVSSRPPRLRALR